MSDLSQLYRLSHTGVYLTHVQINIFSYQLSPPMDKPEIVLVFALSGALFITIALILQSCWKHYAPAIFGSDLERGKREDVRERVNYSTGAAHGSEHPVSSFNAAAVVARH